MTVRNMPAIDIAGLKGQMPSAVLGGVKNEVSLEQKLDQVGAQLTKVTDTLQQTADRALNEATRSGDMSRETKSTVDQLLTQQNGLNNAVQSLTSQLEGTASQLAEVSQAVATGGRGAAAPRQSLGQAFVSHETEIAQFVANSCSGTLAITVKNAITTADGSGGGLIYHEEERAPVNMPYRRLVIRDLLSQGRTNSDLVPYRKQTLRTDATAMVAEEGVYPESAFGWTKVQTPVRKLGAVTNITEETMSDADMLQTEIDTELRYGLALEEEKQILAGDGAGENLHGLIPNATAFAAAAGLPDASRIDRLRLGLLQVVLADYIPTGIVLNPTDWAGIDLLKDSQGRFVHGDPGAQTSPTLWGKSVVESNTMTIGEWLVGDFVQAATYYTRSDAEVLISSEHDQNFVTDMLTMKGRKRAALAVKRGPAMVTGDFTFS